MQLKEVFLYVCEHEGVEKLVGVDDPRKAGSKIPLIMDTLEHALELRDYVHRIGIEHHATFHLVRFRTRTTLMTLHADGRGEMVLDSDDSLDEEENAISASPFFGLPPGAYFARGVGMIRM